MKRWAQRRGQQHGPPPKPPRQSVLGVGPVTGTPTLGHLLKDEKWSEIASAFRR